MQDTLVAGETLNYRADLPDYPASAGWSLRLVLNPRTGGALITVNSLADGDAHLVRAAPAITSGWAASLYGFELWALKTGEQYRVDYGQLKVQQSLLSATAGLDTRSAAERALDAVTALLEGKASSGVESYSIGGRELRSYPLADLIKLQAKLRSDVSAERVAAGLPPLPGTGVRRILTRFR